MSLPSIALTNTIATLSHLGLGRAGMSPGAVKTLIELLTEIQGDVAQLETAVIPPHLRTVITEQDGNVVPLVPRPRPAAVPPQGGAA